MDDAGDLSFMLAEAEAVDDEDRTRFMVSEDDGDGFMGDLLALAEEHRLSVLCSALPAQTHCMRAGTRGFRCCTPAFLELVALARVVAEQGDVHTALVQCCTVMRHHEAHDVLGSVPAEAPSPEPWQQLRQMCAPAVLSHVSRALRSHVVVVAMNADASEWLADFACADPEWLSQPLQLVYAAGRSVSEGAAGGAVEMLRHLDGMDWARQAVNEAARAIDNEVLG